MISDFLTPFVAVGLAELGDKTQLGLILLATKTDRRILLFSGAMLGFLFVDCVAVAAGSWVSTVVSMQVLKAASALMFISFGVLMLRGGGSEGIERIYSKNPFYSSLLLISVTEWGDKTQLAAGLFATRYEPVLVLAGALAALGLLSATAILTGGFISGKIDSEKTSKAAGALFILIGVLSYVVY